MNIDELFPTDYFAARTRFRDAAARLGWRTENHAIDAKGSGGEELTIDAAISPEPTADRVIVVSIGLHGVEGFFGSAVQSAWLTRGRPKPQSTRFVFLHALNPYGFAHLRRYDETNSDPNRNFLLAGEEYSGVPPGYAELDPLLNPRSPPPMWDPFKYRAVWEVFRRGLPAMKRVIMTGQYEYPRGVFYGGSRPSASNLILARNLDRWVAGCREVVHLDFHCGLGPWATHKLLIDYPLSSRHRDRFEHIFGRDVIEVCDAEGTAYPTRGDIGKWCVTRDTVPDYLFACVEFGTYGPITMLEGIRAENRAYHWGEPHAKSTVRAKARLMDLFCPNDSKWRSTVVTDGMAIIDRAVVVGVE